ncbi:hypothetical protein F3J45_01540 [Pantoea sp. Ap-967]|uniref:NEL-type E3 ubiquitin ligase domain-containing protein n=1 Tax=Pantoea sp. Ap-967 TaxID=2608362 RepID=UPI001423550E|nr:NEL-type E3 ubiquitin ligase domain-containing protein [Pantoea sp. Ap-967]NIE73148.1 hypothetical protein [Pantoea sp. Ap-967]
MPNRTHEQESVLAIERAFQDRFIAERLPPWLSAADASHRGMLEQGLRQSLHYRQQVAALLGHIEDLHGFAATRLQAALDQRFRPPLATHALRFSQGRPTRPLPSLGPNRTPVMGNVYRLVPLVDAALLNFTLAETTLGGQPPGNGVVDEQGRVVKSPAALQFAALCRELDLGLRYQQHLDAVLQPASGQGLREPLQGLLRNAMLVDACKARFEGVLNEAELQLVAGLCQQRTLGRLEGAKVVARQLKALGCSLQQIVVLDVQDETFSPLFNRSRRVLVYIPGDPLGAWSAFDNLAAFARHVLDKRLRVSSYQAFFRRFVKRRDSPAFFTQVLAHYSDLPAWATRELDEAMQDYPGELFASLAQGRIEQIKDDAAMIAAPVAAIDRAEQQAQARFLAQIGWASVAGASFFLPGLGLALLAVTAWEMLVQVFQGVEAWRDGDTREAAEHLLNVAADAALLATLAGGGAVARAAWARSPFVDALVPARLQDGSHKLWNQDLRPYQGNLPAAASAEGNGTRRLGEQRWVEMDGHGYPVEPALEPGHWQLRARDGHAPRLLGDGAGAWRVWSAQPLEWADSRQLLRRLGTTFAQLDDTRIDQVLTAHAMGSEQLRALLVLGQAPEAELVDSVQRARLDQRIAALIEGLHRDEAVADSTVLQHARRLPSAAGLEGPALARQLEQQRPALLHACYEASQDSDSADVAVLRRLFPSLNRTSAQRLLRAAPAADLEQLRATGRVSLRLGQAARLSTQRTRVARVYEALQFDAPQGLDLARVVLGLLKHLPGGVQRVGWRLFDRYRSEAVLFSTAAGSRTLDLVHSSGLFLVTDADGAVIVERQGLFQALAQAHGAAALRAMGVTEPFAASLRSRLLALATEHRQALEQSLGLREAWFIPPQRLSDGRVGYPLSGRGTRGGLGARPRALLSWVRLIYPDFTDEQVDAWITQVAASGRDVRTELDRLDREYTDLRKTLRAWLAEADDELLRRDREHVVAHLTEAWRRVGAVGPEGARPITNLRLTVYGIRPKALPPFPANVSFAHISELAMPDMRLDSVPSSFLRAFPNLIWLDLTGSRLVRLPEGLLQMQQLRGLVLANNRLALNAEQSAGLANCWNLEHINLSHNPLGRSFSVAQMRALRVLDLNSTGIRRLPVGLLERRQLVLADLRNNAIGEIPEAFFTSPATLRRALRLEVRTLNAQLQLRVSRSLAAAAREVEGRLPLREREEQLLEEVEPRERWAGEVLVTQRGLLVSSWDKVRSYPGTEPLFRVLRQLLRSADFVRHPANLAQRVYQLLDEMAVNPALCQALVEVANDEWGCRDGATWCFANLEVELLVWHASQGATVHTRAQLLRLARQLWRLDEVDRIAVQDILSRGGDPDQSEVGLAYRVGLRERLVLPIEIAGMSYPGVAGVSEAMLDQAYRRVLAAESPAQLAASAVDRTFWQAYLQRTYLERFLATDEPFQQRLQALGNASSAEHEVLASTIHVDQQVARHELMLDLTREALGHMVQLSPPRGGAS